MQDWEAKQQGEDLGLAAGEEAAAEERELSLFRTILEQTGAARDR